MGSAWFIVWAGNLLSDWAIVPEAANGGLLPTAG
jgi:hypothetical protein